MVFIRMRVVENYKGNVRVGLLRSYKARRGGAKLGWLALDLFYAAFTEERQGAGM